MAGTRSANHQRTVSEPEQREFFPVKPKQLQHEQQRSPFEHNSDGTAEGLDGPIRRFEILKSTPLGLVFPQNVYFSVVDLDAGIAQTGYSIDLPTSSSTGKPVFTTSQLKWWKQKMMLPPAFKVFHGSVDE